jgi:hypothetical protein
MRQCGAEAVMLVEHLRLCAADAAARLGLTDEEQRKLMQCFNDLRLRIVMLDYDADMAGRERDMLYNQLIERGGG